MSPNKKEWSSKALFSSSRHERKRVFAVLLAGSILLFHVSVASAAADPNATEKTKAVLAYLKGLPSKPDNKVLSGQFIGWNFDVDSELFSRINQVSGGIYPALMSGDYVGASGDNDFSETNSLLIDHWKKGGLVEVALHANNPATGEWDNPSDSDWNSSMVVNMIDAVTPGTRTNNNWNAELDRIAPGLIDLQNNGVVVLFRPLLEMNGDWFWWGARDGTEFRNLWIYTFNYLTRTKNLHNLLWVYALNANTGNTLTYYPGDQYVDVVGVDYYSSSGNFPTAYEYQTLRNLGKPFALTELGQCDPSGSNCPSMDSRQIINSIKQYMPDVVYWSNWGDVWALDEHLNVNALLSDPWVVNRGEVNLGALPAPLAPAAPTGIRVR
jgi:mannan endo-1,4-beta-mannosidase